MYDISKRCDKEYDGKFYLAVTSTKIYCLPSCRAKMPKIQNIIFVKYKQEAIDMDFRGCKRCRSEFYPNTKPLWLDNLITIMNNETKNRLDIRMMETITKVNISTIQRYFKNYMHTTVSAYHRRIRIRYAKQLLEDGVELMDLPYNCGYKSLSGFRSAFIQEFGVTPGEIVR